MSKPLIIVESPAKVKTLKKFLGSKYLITSSVGHIRDLPEKAFGIDLENDFTPTYEILPDKKKVVQELKKLCKEASEVYLSPDPDREGEAIAWHISELLPKNTKIHRTAFYAITKPAVLEALEHPKKIDMNLVNAQQARRLLDRIVGYKISPILARKLQRKRGASAGRVQSAALKVVVDREKEIQAFKPVEYWNLSALLNSKQGEELFIARLHSYEGKKWEKEPKDDKTFTIGDEKTAREFEKKLSKAQYHVKKVSAKEKKRNPEPPFITSTLQQEASRHYRYSSSKTMQIAQSLYEGVDLKERGTEGLITYMRTDSTRIEPIALNQAREWIEKKLGKKYLPKSPRLFKQKKAAQDAHEAIRPTNLEHPPEVLKPYLSKEQFNLYELIWKRFIASQVESAVYDTVSADIDTDQKIMLRATGSTIRFKGFLIIYEEKKDEEEGKDSILPPLEEGQKLSLEKAMAEQSFTRPPPRFTEALLVKELEKLGIGRPSTYAAIMNKIQSRDYTTKENNRLKPTELGFVITEFLEANFIEVMNIEFTSKMEDDLELVAQHEKEWKEILQSFWDRFSPRLEKALKESFIPKVMTDKTCPKCGSFLQKIWSKGKYFYGCSNYPNCDFTASEEQLNFNKEEYAPEFDWNQKCPLCQGAMLLRHGRFGPFLGCADYPKCKGIVNIPKKGEQVIDLKKAPPCPAKGCDGKILARKSRMGKTFFSCSNFPECNVIVNNIDDLETKYPDHPKTAYQKTTRKRGEQKEYALSEPLAKVCGFKKGKRTEVIKQTWAYIKKHDLQDPNNKRKIVPDELLAKLFGTKEPIDMFQLPRILANNLR